MSEAKGQVGTRLPLGLIEKLDRRARQAGVTRSEIIRRLLEKATT